MPILTSLSWPKLKKNRGLLTLFAIIGVGGFGATFYILRLATQSPDVSWRKAKNPEPWQEYENKQYKFYRLGMPKKYITPEERPKF